MESVIVGDDVVVAFSGSPSLCLGSIWLGQSADGPGMGELSNGRDWTETFFFS